MTRIRNVDNQKELERLIDDFITRGYKIKENGQYSCLVKDKDWGDGGVHLIIAALTIWWTFGLGNALYGIYKRVTAEEVLIRVEGTASQPRQPQHRGATTGPSADGPPQNPQAGQFDNGRDRPPQQPRDASDRPQQPRDASDRAQHQSPNESQSSRNDSGVERRDAGRRTDEPPAYQEPDESEEE